LLEDWISLLGSIVESVDHSSISGFVGLKVISILSIFELENLLLNDIIEVLVWVLQHGVIHEVEVLGVHRAISGNIKFIELVLYVFILNLQLDISLEVVSILLLVFSKVTEEIGVVLSPSLILLLNHSLLSSFMIQWISHSSRIKLLNLVKHPIYLPNGFLSFIPVLIDISTDWSLHLVGHIFHLIIDPIVGHVHGVDLLVGLLEPLELVGWVNHDSIHFVVVHVDVDVCRWHSLHVRVWSITEWLEETDMHIFFSNLKVCDLSKHTGIIIVKFRGLVLQPNNLETLTAHVASVHGALPNEVEGLLM